MAALLWLASTAYGRRDTGVDERWVLHSMLLPSLLMLLMSQVDVLAIPLLLLAELDLPKFSVGIPSFVEGVYSLVLTDHLKQQLSRHEPSRLQLRGALYMLLGTVMSVMLLVAILGGFIDGDRSHWNDVYTGLDSIDNDEDDLASFAYSTVYLGVSWMGAPARSWLALLALMASRLVRMHGSLTYNRSRGDTKSAAMSSSDAVDGGGKIRKQSNQALSTLLASLRYVANASVSPIVGVVAHRFGAVSALAIAIPPGLLMVLVLAPRSWHVEMDSLANRPLPMVVADEANTIGFTNDDAQAKQKTRGYGAVWNDPAVRSMLLWQSAFLVMIIYIRKAYETLLPLYGLQIHASHENIGYALSLTFWMAFAVSLLKPTMAREWRGIPACLLIALGHALMGWDKLGGSLNTQLPSFSADKYLLMVIGILFGLADGISAGIKGEIKTDAQNEVQSYFLRGGRRGSGSQECSADEAREIKRAYASMYGNFEKLTIPTRMVVAGIADVTSVGTSALVVAGVALVDAVTMRLGGLGDELLGANLRRRTEDEDMGPRPESGVFGERRPLLHLPPRGDMQLVGSYA
mmetsp:Transcript_28655/g.52301  ORF Transcript_28655/g.52301 Transcript_28655/m.52301 type:complete len:576 (-) Transcript_28655:361-2088(-)|eukprot:CAMPEP_0196141250 /NCGR_PEP_ID=MMETSP0910-20130528/9287_1 /TAXON_ID=49265 /ORGANISM="Thalassiosira rotula, Strain GSO102" /LENGTH=575 /DNA_ID=CAMNT_0041402355 /DNA_START=112 /DNA_END=1839 /DNA_ORIENTATION=+